MLVSETVPRRGNSAKRQFGIRDHLAVPADHDSRLARIKRGLRPRPAGEAVGAPPLLRWVPPRCAPSIG